MEIQLVYKKDFVIMEIDWMKQETSILEQDTIILELDGLYRLTPIEEHKKTYIQQRYTYCANNQYKYVNPNDYFFGMFVVIALGAGAIGVRIASLF